jgi:hypothetical protein
MLPPCGTRPTIKNKCQVFIGRFLIYKIMREHYLYIYLDPRKEGNFKYGEFEFPFEPFYVGVSKNEGRSINHLAYARKYMKDGIVPRSKQKIFKITSILKNGLEPVITMVRDNLTESDAYELEIRAIATIGRVNMKTGPLLNVLIGGQIIDGELISKILSERIDISQEKSRPVKRFTVNGDFIDEWPSVAKAKTELSINHIDACCRGQRKSAGGYTWKYSDGVILLRSQYRQRKKNNIKNKTSIEQYKDGQLINSYDSITEAASATGVGRKNISNVLTGYSNTAGGYIWKYKTKH